MTKTSSLQNLKMTTAGIAFSLASGCAHLAGLKQEQYNICPSPEKFDHYFGQENANMPSDLVKFPIAGAIGFCYLGQEIVLTIPRILAFPECGVRIALHKDSPTKNPPPKKDSLPPFCRSLLELE